MKKFLLVCNVFAAGAFLQNAAAQTDMSKWKVEVFPSALQYVGPRGSEFFQIKPMSGAVAFGAGYRLNSSFDLEGTFMGGNLNYQADTLNPKFTTKVYDLTASVVYRLNNGYILKEEARIAPFVFAGAGPGRSEYGWNATANLGGGINFRIAEDFAMQLRTAFKPNTEKEYNMVQHSLGFIFHIPKAGEKTVAADQDHDGVPDSEDGCPAVKGELSNGGCPVIDNETQTVLNDALTGIQFETGSDKLLDVSYPKLDNVAQIMAKHPEYKLSIEGHTDTVGDDAVNLDLSKRRAVAAMKYLQSKGVQADRMTAEGYGETRPIDTNETSEGRARNRRVEFKVVF